MPHERIWAHNDPTWHTTSVNERAPLPGETAPEPAAAPPPDVTPGVLVQWHDLPANDHAGAVGIATGNLNLVHDDDVTKLDDPRLSVDVTAILGEPHDSDTATAYEQLTGAITQAVQHAYTRGVATPYMVWVDRGNLNQLIRTERRARTTAYGADE